MLDKKIIENYLQNVKINSDAIESFVFFTFIFDVFTFFVSGYNWVYIPILVLLNALFIFIYIKNKPIIEISKKKYCLYSSVILIKSIISTFLTAYSALIVRTALKTYYIIMFLLALIIVGILSFVSYTFISPKSNKAKTGGAIIGATPAVAIGPGLGFAVSRTVESIDTKIVIAGCFCLLLSLLFVV